MTTERLLLCRPLGGLNDMLCQIENACRYAERFDRSVIVDTRHHSKTYFRDSFSTYFASRRERLMLDAEPVPIFLATDNRQTLAYFLSIFGAERIRAFARLPEVAGERLHHIDDVADAYERNRDSILDVVLLGLASRLYLFELEPNAYGARYSGYSVLAANLHNSRPLLRDLISDDPAELAAVGLGPA